MKLDSYLVGKTVYCKKDYSINTTDRISIGMKGIVMDTLNFSYVIYFDSHLMPYVHPHLFDKYFCTIKEIRKLKLEKINGKSNE